MTDIDDLVRCVTALLELDRQKALVPHGLPAVAREYLTEAAAALERMRDELADTRRELSACEQINADVVTACEERDAAEAEVARMRGVLRRIQMETGAVFGSLRLADAAIGKANAIARQALA